MTLIATSPATIAPTRGHGKVNPSAELTTSVVRSVSVQSGQWVTSQSVSRSATF